MKKICCMLLCVALLTASFPVIAEQGDFIKSTLEADTYTVSGEISVTNEDYLKNDHPLNVHIPAGKIVILSFLNRIDDAGNMLPNSFPNDAYNISYLGLNETETGRGCEIWGGGWSVPSRLRYFRTTEEQNGLFTITAGLEKKAGAQNTVPFTWKYTVSVKIVDAVNFEPLDPQGKVTGDKNFFFSSAPEGLTLSELYQYDKRQYLCRAPVNGNANIYWSHMNKTGKPVYFGVLLTNKEHTPLTIKTNACSVVNSSEGQQWSGMYTRMFVDPYDLSKGYAGGEGAKDEPLVLQPGQSAWLHTYQLVTQPTGETTGIIQISVNDGSYLGHNLLCTTYLFDMPEFLAYIPMNTADWEVEAAPDGTAMRGSGNGAILNMTDTAQTLPFSTVLTGEDKLNPGENILVTRLEHNQYYTGDNKYSLKRIPTDEFGTLPPLTEDELRGVWTYNCNFGTIYRFDLSRFQAEYGLQQGKKVVGKIKLSPRSAAVVASQVYNKTFDGGLNMAVWRTKNGVIDYANGTTITLARNPGIDPSASQTLYPQNGYWEGQASRSKEGVYWEFDVNMPFFDSANEYSYYIVGSGMSSLPFEVTFEYEDISLSPEPYSVYVEEEPVLFQDVRPQLVEGRTMVPLRGVFEKLGASVSYGNGSATVFAEDKVINVKIGEDILVVYDLKNFVRKEIKIDVPPQLVGDRTMVPLRAISEAMGCRVEWAPNIQAVFIYSL